MILTLNHILAKSGCILAIILQVVDTLMSIKNGKTCIGNFSPISDPVTSISDSIEVEAEDGKTK